ncbi:hypothetical protein COCNU_scaffold000154G000070 [Cocos nucifera]|nr:hypothetical protein [Cocos nucifera]
MASTAILRSLSSAAVRRLRFLSTASFSSPSAASAAASRITTTTSIFRPFPTAHRISGLIPPPPSPFNFKNWFSLLRNPYYIEFRLGSAKNGDLEQILCFFLSFFSFLMQKNGKRGDERFNDERSSSGFGRSDRLNFRLAFSSNVSQLPAIADPDIEAAFKDLMAMNWDEIPDSVVNETKKALSKVTEDKAGQEALTNVFRAAEASVEFGGILVTLRMALDDLNGLSGENVGRLPDYIEDAVRAAYERYTAYLDSFGPSEAYLRKKVETELGTKMIHLKMRCSGIGSEWGKIRFRSIRMHVDLHCFLRHSYGRFVELNLPIHFFQTLGMGWSPSKVI